MCFDKKKIIFVCNYFTEEQNAVLIKKSESECILLKDYEQQLEKSKKCIEELRSQLEINRKDVLNFKDQILR